MDTAGRERGHLLTHHGKHVPEVTRDLKEREEKGFFIWGRVSHFHERENY